MSLSFVGRDPCPAADALAGLGGSCSPHEELGEGARRGSGEPPHENLSHIAQECLCHNATRLEGAAR